MTRVVYQKTKILYDNIYCEQKNLQYDVIQKMRIIILYGK